MENQRTSQMRLLFVGDVMLGRLVNSILQEKPAAYPWGDTLSLFHDADVRLCNLECVLSDWGTLWSTTPKVFHFRSDAKNIEVLKAAHADLIFGHSGHVVRGIELYRGKPILYCTGDFIDDYAVDEVERNDQSFIFVVEMDGHLLSRLLLYPTVIEAFQARRAKDNEREAIVARMQKLCMQLNTITTWDEQAERLEVQMKGS